MVTLTGVIGTVVLLGERYGWTVWLAVGLILASVTRVKPMRVIRTLDAQRPVERWLAGSKRRRTAQLELQHGNAIVRRIELRVVVRW